MDKVIWPPELESLVFLFYFNQVGVGCNLGVQMMVSSHRLAYPPSSMVPR